MQLLPKKRANFHNLCEIPKLKLKKIYIYS